MTENRIHCGILFPMDPDSQRTKAPCAYDDALAVLIRLREAGHIAYFAGGCVRDMLMKLEPQDYDVATDAPPATVRRLFSNTQAVGASFGVILVRQGASVVEVATFRTDGVYSDGRRPDSVQFATAEKDAQRRDFTMNGLFLDPLHDKVIDYVGGRADIEQRRLRAIGDAGQRFEEDHLRMLRAVRFAARFDLRIDAATGAAIQRAAPRLKGISPERIAEELRLILTPPTRRKAWGLLWELGLGQEIFRLLPGNSAPCEKSVFLAVAPGEPIPFALALAAAILDVGQSHDADIRAGLEKSQVHRCVTAMRKSLRISNEESDAMAQTLEGLAPLLAATEPRLAIKKRFLARPTASQSRQLLAALARIGWFVERAASLAADLAALEKTVFSPPPLITGDDLTAMGMTPGPRFKQLLDTAYDAQLEGRVTHREEAMSLVMSLQSARPDDRSSST